MEAELTIRESAAPGLTTRDHGNQALGLRETDCYSGQRPYNLGLFHTGCTGGSDGLGERTIFGLNTAIQAVGEGNYGRLGPGRQQRYTDAEAEPMFGQPFTGGTPDEQPGALPEILPSPDFDRPGPRDANIDRCWTCRAMFVQAWGHYGTAWPVVHQQLGVRPDMGRRRLELTPQVPQGQSRVAGSNIRLGRGAVERGGLARRQDLSHGRASSRGAFPLRDRPHAAARSAGEARASRRPSRAVRDPAHEPRPRGARARPDVGTARAPREDALANATRSTPAPAPASGGSCCPTGHGTRSRCRRGAPPESR